MRALFTTLILMVCLVFCFACSNQASFEELFTQNLSFDEWVDEYNNAKSYSDEEKLILQKMAETASTFVQWNIVRKKAPYDSKFNVQALYKMAELAHTTEEWHKILRLTLYGEDDLEKLALKNINKLCNKFEDWLMVYKLDKQSNYPTPSMVNIAMENMINHIQTFKQAHITCDLLAENGQNRQRALVSMTSLATSYNEWEIIFDKTHWQDKENRQLALKNMTLLASEFTQWQKIYNHSYEGSYENQQSLKQMYEQAKTFSQWAHAYAVTPATADGHSLKKFAFAKMNHYQMSFDEWYKVWDKHNSQKVRSLALDKLLKSAYAFEDWQKIWKNSPSGSHTEALALKKMQELTSPTP